MQITSQFTTSSQQKASRGLEVVGSSFTAALASSSISTARKPFRAELVSGHIGVDVQRFGYPYQVSFFDDAGQKIGSTGFDAPSILAKLEQLRIDKSELNGLADKLDAAGVKYKPYELFGGGKSNAGIDLRDLAAGGLGTAYDWRVDANVQMKGVGAVDRQAGAQALADRLGVVANPLVTGAKPLKSQAELVPSVDQSATYDVSTSAMSVLRDQERATNASRSALLSLTQSWPSLG